MNHQTPKAGDTIRFLNATGGGIVTRVERGLAYVEDQDGFEIPTPINECVVVSAGDTFIPAYKPPKLGKYKNQGQDPKADAAPQINREDFDSPGIISSKPEPKLPHTFLPGGNKLNVYLAFLSADVKRLGQSPYLAYLVNDSNYVLHFTYMNQQEGTRWHLRHAEVVEPNMKVLIEQFEASDLNELERLAVQFVAYQTDRSFDLKPAVAVQVHLDTVKFFKLHSFGENDFFNEPAWVIPIVEDDIPMGGKSLDAEKIETAMKAKKHADREPARKPQPVKPQANEVMEIDLHAAELLDNTRGMSAGDILQYQLSKFREVMDTELKHRGRKIVFIHGKGEGVLRKAVEQELKKKYPHCRYQDASFREYGYGATLVTIG